MEGYVKINGFRVKVKILKQRHIFGRLEYLVEPTEGSGQEWKSNVETGESND